MESQDRARAARAWDEWAMATELGRATATKRPRLRIQVAMHGQAAEPAVEVDLHPGQMVFVGLTVIQEADLVPDQVNGGHHQQLEPGPVIGKATSTWKPNPDSPASEAATEMLVEAMPAPTGNDAVAEFFASWQGERLWQHWILRRVGEGDVRRIHGDAIFQTLLANEIMLRDRRTVNTTVAITVDGEGQGLLAAANERDHGDAGLSAVGGDATVGAGSVDAGQEKPVEHDNGMHGSTTGVDVRQGRTSQGNDNGGECEGGGPRHGGGKCEK